jgi:type II secretory pathway pseudopilin PulG
MLLIVVIILILAAMLLPSLEIAYQRANLAVCANLLEQQHVASRLYADDNNTYLPATSKNGLNYNDFIFQYLGQDKDVYICPSGPSSGGQQYGVNHYGYDNVDGDGINNHHGTLSNAKLFTIAYPEQVIHLSDADPGQSPHDVGGAQSGTTGWPLTSLAERRHLGGYQAIHVDSHVERYPNAPNHADRWAILRSDHK